MYVASSINSTGIGGWLCNIKIYIKNVNEKGRHKIIKIISLCLKNYNLKYYYNGRCVFFPYSDGTVKRRTTTSRQAEVGSEKYLGYCKVPSMGT